MAVNSHSIEVDAPLHAVYRQWMRFEEFPHFMEGVEAVQQTSEDRLFWKARVGGKIKEWEAKIIEHIPDQRIAWQSVDGSSNSGVITFEELSPTRTRVHATMAYEPEGLLERTGDALGIPSLRVEGDLNRFREYVEAGRATGGWRGEMTEGESPYVEGSNMAATETSSTAPLTGHETVDPAAETQQMEIPAERTIDVALSEEELLVGKRTIDAGEVRLRKVITTEIVNVPVELKRENVIIERVSPDELEGSGSVPFLEEKIVIPLSREEAVVEKVSHVTGGVRITKTESVEKKTIQESVRRENLDVDETGPATLENRLDKEKPDIEV